MSIVLPSTVEELNQLHNSMDIPSPMYNKVSKGFENIIVEKRYKREVSLPNGLENWNIGNFDPYLTFEENFEEFKAIESIEDRVVPEDYCDPRNRCDSFSSTMSLSMDDKKVGVVHQNYGVKTFNTVCMDSGSTCISSDHSYVSPSSSFYKGLEAEETYQNLDLFLQQVPEVNLNENLPSPLSSTDSNFELSSLHSSFALPPYSPAATKRPASAISDEDNFPGTIKVARLEDILVQPPSERYVSDQPPAYLDNQPPSAGYVSDQPPSNGYVSDQPQSGGYTEGRRKNNISSKNCRKTRKEKQKEMEVRVTDLEKEKQGLKVEVQLLEELIQAHKMQLYAILQKR